LAVLGFELGFHSWVGQVAYHLSHSTMPQKLFSKVKAISVWHSVV
jgi:hypothetical protein